MSLTLKESITATQTTIDVNGTDALSNGDLYSIEDEQVFIVNASAGTVQPGQTAWQRLNVQRGQLGTTEASHAANTAVTSVEIPLGAGGGVQTVRLLGPFTVNFDTVPFSSGAGFARHRLASLATGTVVIWARAFKTVNFATADAVDLFLQMNNADFDTWDTLAATYDNLPVGTGLRAGQSALNNDPAKTQYPVHPYVLITGSGVDGLLIAGTGESYLACELNWTGSDPTAGSFYVLALTAEPS